MALLIMLDLNIAQKFGGDMDTLDRLESRIDHSSMGLIIASLFICETRTTAVFIFIFNLFAISAAECLSQSKP